jgi:hypothetical protein
MSLPRPTRKLTPGPVSADPSAEPVYKRHDFKPSDVFRFTPAGDITVQELAEIFALLCVDVHHDAFFELPETLHRHFRPRKT